MATGTAPGQRRLDVCALPSLTTVETAMIVALVTGALLLINLGAPSLALWGVLFLLVLLTLRGFLSWPERMARKHRLSRPGPELAPLRQRIRELSWELGLPRPPVLAVSPGSEGLATFGTFRRWYLWCGRDTARRLAERAGSDPALDAALIHELCHFQHGDHLRVGAARAALRTGALVMAWTAAFHLGLMAAAMDVFTDPDDLTPDEMVALLYESSTRSGLAVPPPPSGLDERMGWDDKTARVDEVSPRRVTLSLLFNTLPVAAVLGLLLLISWRRLHRTREHYADLAAARHLGDGGALIRSLFSLAPPGRGPGRGWLRSLLARTPGLALLGPAHPSAAQRLSALRDPRAIVASPWRTGLWLAAFLLVVETILQSTSAVMVAGRSPMLASVVAGYLLISVHGILRASGGQYRRRDIPWIMGIALVPQVLLIAVAGVYIAVTLALAPQLTEAALNETVANLSGYGGTEELDLFEGNPTAYLVQSLVVGLLRLPAVFLLVVVASMITVGIYRRLISRTAGMGGGRPVLWRVYAVLAGVAVGLAGGVLPGLTAIIQGDVDRLTSPALWLVSVPIALGSAIVVLLTAVLPPGAPRCPACGEPELADEGDFVLCRACGAERPPWPWTRYSVEAA